MGLQPCAAGAGNAPASSSPAPAGGDAAGAAAAGRAAAASPANVAVSATRSKSWAGAADTGGPAASPHRR